MSGQNLNFRMLDLASFYIGVTEAGGANRGPLIERFQKAVDGKALGEPWCMSFMQFLALETALVHQGYSRMHQSESCLEVWNKTPWGCRVVLPSRGLVAIWQHGNSNAGHTGIVHAVFGDRMQTVEGNTGPGIGIVREGDGVYIRERPISGRVGNMTLLGFLRVFA